MTDTKAESSAASSGMRNFEAIRRILWYTMLLNFAATAVKLGAGLFTGSLSVIADGFDSLFDGASNIVGLVGISIASRPADKGHPYGHRKYETLSALAISVLLFVTCIELVRNAFGRLTHPVEPAVSIWNFAALVFSVVVHVYVASYEYRQGKRLKSEVLVADSLHTRADVFVSVAVIAGQFLIRWGYPVVDAILTLIIAVLIAKIGVDIIKEGSGILADAVALVPSEVQRVVLGVEGVETCHKIRSRGQEDDVHVDLHIQVRPQCTIEKAHGIAHQVQISLRDQFDGISDVVVHIEPGFSEPELSDGLIEQVRRVASRLSMDVHGVNVHEIDGRYYLDLHTEMGARLSLEQAHELASELERAIIGEIPAVGGVTSHMEPVREVAREI